MRARMFSSLSRSFSTAAKKEQFPWGPFVTGVVAVNAALFAVTVRETRQEQEELEAAQRQAHLEDLEQDLKAAKSRS